MKTTCGVGRYSGTAPTEGDTLAFPIVARNIGVSPGIIYGHGGNNLYNTALDAVLGYYQQLRALVDVGRYPLVFADLAGSAWGNDACSGTANNSACRYLDAYNWLQNTAGGGAAVNGVHVVGVSHNGCGAINWTKRNIAKVRSLSLIVPVVNLTDTYTNDRGGNQANINTAHGGVPDYANRDPLLITIPAGWPPTKIWCASNDPVTPTLADNQTFLNRLTGTGHQLRNMGAVGHTLSAVDPAELLAFIRST